MHLTNLEREFLQRLSAEAWTSTALFDHDLVARLVEAGYVRADLLESGCVRYEISDTGRTALTEREA